MAVEKCRHGNYEQYCKQCKANARLRKYYQTPYGKQKNLERRRAYRAIPENWEREKERQRRNARWWLYEDKEQ